MVLGEDRIRELWEEQRGEPIDDDAFEAMRAVYLGADDTELVFNTPREALDAQCEVEDRLRRAARARENKPGSVRLELDPPRGWSSFQQRRFDTIFGDQVGQVRALFGLSPDAAVELNEIPRLLLEAAREQEWPPIPIVDVKCGQLYFHGDPASGLVDVPVCREPSEGDAPGKKRRLAELYTLTRQMYGTAGIRDSYAIEYILGGVPPWAPWIDAEWMALGGDEGLVELKIGSLDVKPEEVAAAYARARREALALSAGKPVVAFRRGGPSAKELIDFCEPLRSKLKPVPWEDIAERWNEAHPDREYKNGDALSRVYRRYIDTLEGGE
ncbi:MAG: hypothetical protein U1E22_07465 [Coriobacteriia bacterium]|nr:hypothetical protein [Coriobacteriia bacterium]